MAVGRYITDAINKTIMNERQSMANRFSAEVNQRRFDEANAYRDKAFAENVRQFEKGHALREAAGKRAETRLTDDLKTSAQTRELRGKAEERADFIHKWNYDPETGFMELKKGWEQDFHAWRKAQEEDRVEVHERTWGEGGLIDRDEERKDKKLELDEEKFLLLDQETQQRLALQAYQQKQRDEVFNFNYGDPDVEGDLGYLGEQRERAGTIFDTQYGEGGTVDLQNQLLKKQVDTFNQITPYERARLAQQDRYQTYLENTYGGKTGGGDFSVPQQRQVVSEDELIKEVGVDMRKHANDWTWNLFRRGAWGITPPFVGSADSVWEHKKETIKNPDGTTTTRYLKPGDANQPELVKGIESSAANAALRLKDNFYGDAKLATQNLVLLFNKFVRTDDGKYMVKKWKGALKAESDFEAIEAARKVFVDAGIKALVGDYQKQLKEQGTSRQERQLDSPAR